MLKRMLTKGKSGILFSPVAAMALFMAMGAGTAFAAESGFITPYCNEHAAREGGMEQCIKKEKDAKRYIEKSSASSSVKSYCASATGGDNYSYYLMEKCIKSITKPQINVKKRKKGQVVPFPKRQDQKKVEMRKKVQEKNRKIQEMQRKAKNRNKSRSGGKSR